MTRLAHDVLQEGTGEISVWFLHGILGSRRNWRSFVRRLGRERPDVTLVTIDIRNHGESPHPPPPHTLDDCAADLVELASHLGRAPTVVVGHSFGGKVALAFAQRADDLRQVWVLDAVPGPVHSAADLEVSDVIEALQSIPTPIGSYEDLTRELEGRGFSRSLASWMTTNLERSDGGFTWRFALDAIPAMIDSYAHTDFWPWLLSTAMEVHVVRAGASDRWTPDELRRLDQLADRPQGHVHVLEDAGHWVQVDAPDALRALLVGQLP